MLQQPTAACRSVSRFNQGEAKVFGAREEEGQEEAQEEEEEEANASGAGLVPTLGALPTRLPEPAPHASGTGVGPPEEGAGQRFAGVLNKLVTGKMGSKRPA